MFIIGHRGARAVEPENTLRAMKTGMTCADYIEVDVRLSCEGIPVIMHDPMLDRTTNGTGPVNAHTLEELKSLDAGRGESIPTLEEVCRLVSGRCGLFVEIKERGSETAISRVIREFGLKDLFVVSFHQESIIAALSHLPGVRTGIIVSKETASLPGAAQELGTDAVLPKFALLNDALIAEYHARDLLVVSWTLNTPEEFMVAASLGIDGFATDDPCRARKYFQARKKFHESE